MGTRLTNPTVRVAWAIQGQAEKRQCFPPASAAAGSGNPTTDNPACATPNNAYDDDDEDVVDDENDDYEVDIGDDRANDHGAMVRLPPLPLF